MKFFVAGIGTEVGKTVASAVIAEALQAYYWKPIQAGDLEDSDSIKVKRWTQNVVVLKERYCLFQPMSPHAAAKIDGIEIKKEDFQLPDVEGNLIVEGAGGLMVPINEHGFLMLDLVEYFDLPVILVSRNYLGSINHTLLSVEALKNRGISIAGILFNGEENKETERIILEYSGLKKIGRIPQADIIDKSFVIKQAGQLKQLLINS